MQITSSAFEESEEIPAKYTCDAENVSPPLEFWDIPENTASLALLIEDPDAPSGLFTHWILFNIPFNITKISEGAIPQGAIEGKNDAGGTGYVGPCPPSGTHRYIFSLYALDRILPLSSGVEKERFIEEIAGHTLEKTELTGTYTR